MAAMMVFVVFLVGIALSIPIGVSMILGSVAPIMLLGKGGTIVQVLNNTFSGANSTPILAVPLFILGGVIMAEGGISKKLFNFFAYFVGRFPGGVPCAVIMTCLFYGAISGSGPATTAAVGAMCIPFMVSLGYDKVWSAGLISVAGGLGVIIPPSIPFVLYSLATGVSTGALFLAGIIPGILIGAVLMLVNYVVARKYGYGTLKKFNLKTLLTRLKDSIWALLVPVIILGGIYGGIFTPTESAVVAIVYSLIIGVFVYKELDLKGIYATLRETVLINGQTTFLVGLSLAFARYLTMAQVPAKVAGSILNLSSPILILLMINLLLLVIGCFIDNISSTVILTPILLPIVTGLGMSPIQFGIVMTVNLAIGFITPPYGANLFYASAVGKVSIERIAAKIMPMIAVMLVVLLALTFIPQISLGLLSLR